MVFLFHVLSSCNNYTHYHYSSLHVYLVNSFIANVICYITIPSLNKVVYLVSCIYQGRVRETGTWDGYERRVLGKGTLEGYDGRVRRKGMREGYEGRDMWEGYEGRV